jgi:response regulator RpfG family c-di-GMP phosphodiesterase
VGDATGVEAGVLGRLLLMQSVIASLPDSSILSFVVQGLSDIEVFGPVEYRREPQEGGNAPWRFTLTSNTGQYGELTFKPPDDVRFAAHEGHVRNFLFMLALILDERRHRAILADHRRQLEALVAERTRELLHRNRQLLAAQAATMTAFSALTQARHHEETGSHIQRTRHYVRALAKVLQGHPRFREQLQDDDTLQMFSNSAPLHDIGKVAIPDTILLKPGKLTAEEWTVMKRHCAIGRNAIVAAAHELGEGDDAFLACAADIAYCHHERWDGSGYPRGLTGEAIPLSARIMAVADVYDALISRRDYKEAYTHEAALLEMAGESGRHFDPDILEAMLNIADQFQQIAESYKEDPDD